MSADRPSVLHAASVRAWGEQSLAALGEERAAIDALNVFPVPDGDTGTNMFLTVESACAAMEEVCEPGGARLADVVGAMTYGAMMGARGNSGVILAQVIRGVATALSDCRDGDRLTADHIRAALRRASDEAYAAVAHPVEGTILTVARAAAEAAEEHSGDDLIDVIAAAVEAARAALERTPDQLPVLRDAGVVDAGGAGLVVVYDALLDVVTGVRRRRPRRDSRPKLPAPARSAHGLPVAEEGAPAYEVMYLLTAPADHVDVLRSTLDRLGDSLVVTGADELWNVHVHVHDAGAAIEAGLTVGQLDRIRITYLPPTAPGTPLEGRRLVVVTHGPGVEALVIDSDGIAVPARPRRRPSTGEFSEAIAAARAAEVIVMPSDSDSLAVAEAAAEQARSSGVRVSVIPTRSVVQSLAAIAVHDPAARFDEDVVAMTRAAGATRYGAVTEASREALTMAGPCVPGDILGIADGDIVEIGDSVHGVALAVAERLLSSGGELLTLVGGQDADPTLLETLADSLSRDHAGIEVVSLEGGQPLWPIIIGVE
jgi:DAK2 domain fusion protein YloV